MRMISTHFKAVFETGEIWIFDGETNFNWLLLEVHRTSNCCDKGIIFYNRFQAKVDFVFSRRILLENVPDSYNV